MLKKIPIILAIGLSTYSCSNSEEEAKMKEALQDLNKVETVSISKEVINEMLRTMPQPIEIANIITGANMPFTKEALLPSDQAKSYPDKFHQAMGFGAYGVDLGYINLNEKTLYTIEYLECLNDVSKQLQVDQFFDFALLADITKNKKNTDSLIQISTKNFNKIDDYLKEQNRGELSILILIGAWTEGMHVFCELNKKNPNEELMKKIGEQKIVFENIYTILATLKAVDHFSKLKTDFEEIKKTYDLIKITTEFQPPETKEVNGELVIIDKSKTNVEYTKENIQSLTISLGNLRTKYLLAKIK